MAAIDTVIINKLLGTTTQVRVKRYGDGTIAFQEVTAGGPEHRFPRRDAHAFLKAMVEALNTVA